MNKREIRAQVAQTLGIHEGNITVTETGGKVDLFYVSQNITFDMLQRLSEVLGTRNINFECMAGSEGYSEYTPGSPNQVELVWRR